MKSLMKFEPELKASQRFCSLFFRNPKGKEMHPHPCVGVPVGEQLCLRPTPSLNSHSGNIAHYLTICFVSLRGQRQTSFMANTSGSSDKREGC